MEKKKAPRVRRHQFTVYDIERFRWLKDSGGRTPATPISWQEVAEIVMVDKKVLKSVVSNYEQGKRDGMLERVAERRASLLVGLTLGIRKGVIADILGISKNTVSVDLNRMKKK